MADGVTEKVERLRKALLAEYGREAGERRTFLIEAADLLIGADRMATGIRRAVKAGTLNARSMAADACLDYEGQRERLE